MELTKGQVVTVVKTFEAQGKKMLAGKKYKVFMASEGKKAAALLIELTKAGKEKSVYNMNNVRALHEGQVATAAAEKYISFQAVEV